MGCLNPRISPTTATMGYRWRGVGLDVYKEPEYSLWLPGAGVAESWEEKSRPRYTSSWQAVPFYSTDVSAAFKVVDRMMKRGYWLELKWLELKSPFFEGESWWAGFTPLKVTGWNGEPDNNMAGDTAMLAICRAALESCCELEANA